MKKLALFIILLLVVSCGSYKIQTRQPQISHIIALTKEGDTINVPVEALQRDLTPDYYDGYRFYWNNSWWLYNDWYWNYYYPNPRLFIPRYQVYTPRPRVSVPQQPKRVYIPRHFEPRGVESPIRGRNNQTPPVRQQQTRIQQQPKTQPPQRQQPAVRQQQTPKTTNGGRPIKQ
jgi:hypothetical protein